MHSIISIVGKSGSGKTTLLENLIVELKQRGYKVAIIKHSHHANDLDTASKDTWRFTRAGSELSVINSLDHLAIYKKMDRYFDPQEISDFISWDYDLILTEGFKGSHYPKIEVHQSEQGEELLTDPEQLLAVVTNKALALDIPQFSREDIKGICNLIENTLIKYNRENNLNLIVNGKTVPIESPLEDLITRTLLAMIPGQTDNGVVKNLHISLRRNA
jgi:molybdopterin-guanine dinucleotide biosynthesis protein MobB